MGKKSDRENPRNEKLEIREIFVLSGEGNPEQPVHYQQQQQRPGHQPRQYRAGGGRQTKGKV